MPYIKLNAQCLYSVMNKVDLFICNFFKSQEEKQLLTRESENLKVNKNLLLNINLKALLFNG